MYYSAIGSLAILILCIENYTLLSRRGKDEPASRRAYRTFLITVLIYYVTDVFWGVLETQKLAGLLFADTLVYFAAMAASLLCWTRYVVIYLKEETTYGRTLLRVGQGFFAAVLALVVLNVFTPVLFSVDENCVYRAGQVRYVILVAQILLLIQISGYAFYNARLRGHPLRKRYRTIALFSVVMAGFLLAQLWEPYLPLYSMAYMVGTCLVHAFVINDENEEFRARITEAYERERQQLEELKNTRRLAYRDALTGVRSKLAYAETEEERDRELREGSAPAFAVAIFDINGLKEINDRLGHESGDRAIREVCREICTQFKHSPVFRVGGDEFVALLENEDFRDRRALAESFDRLMRERREAGRASVAMGMEDCRPGEDMTVREIFVRADRRMYEQKNGLKTEA